MIELIQAGSEERELLWNLHQKFLYEMTGYYANEMDERGNIQFGDFDAYFTDPRRSALLIRHDGRLAGFALVHPYSNLDETPDHVLAAFTVFPSLRRRHIAVQAAQAILTRYQGRWEIKYNEKNTAARGLWHMVTAPYGPRAVSLNAEETVLTFTAASSP